MALMYSDPGIFEPMFGKGDLVFDVGACIGQFAEWMLSRGARVVAVEPEKRDVEELQRRFGDNPDVTIVPKALGEKAGTGHLAVNGAARTISTFVPQEFWGEGSAFKGTSATWTEDVPMTTLDALIAEHGRPRFVKIDVEGYESWVLRGLSQPIPYIQFEICCTTWARGRVKECFERILALAPDALFNYTVDESNAFECYEPGEDRFAVWRPADVVLKAIEQHTKVWSLFWGNAFARMGGDGQPA